jgi:hypothetical protein
MEKSSSGLLEFGLNRARALSLLTASLNLGSSLELEPKLGPTSSKHIAKTEKDLMLSKGEYVCVRKHIAQTEKKI